MRDWGGPPKGNKGWSEPVTVTIVDGLAHLCYYWVREGKARYGDEQCKSFGLDEIMRGIEGSIPLIYQVDKYQLW